ncbi:MAG: twin-arginine translocase TatA/TatE family subunit [Desulfarculales bacterium]|jgi:sec-independent protein translocase protein TatA|nr:twin-arginine translocase TatA/TatE family subunit [Desulfarculales bacterium]
MFANIGWPQLLIILLIVLVLFGARRLPQLGDNLGKAIRNFRGSLSGEEKEKTDNEKSDS